MEHIALAVSFAGLCVGLMALVLFSFIYRKFRVPVLRHYIWFMAVFLFRIATQSIEIYIVNILKIWSPGWIYDILYIVYYLWYFPFVYCLIYFFRHVLELGFSERLKTVFLSVLSALVVLMGVFLFADTRHWFEGKSYFSRIADSLFVVIFVYILVITIRHYRKVRHEFFRKLMKQLIGICAAFFPFYVITILDIFRVIDASYFPYIWTALFGAVWNVASLILFFGYFTERVSVATVPSSVPPNFVKAFGLTNREREILELVAAGGTNDDIAAGLFISVKTVEKHLTNMFAKTKVKNRKDLLNSFAVYAEFNDTADR